jgi:hypothetical protein
MERFCPASRYYRGVPLKGLLKTTMKTSVIIASGSPGRDSNRTLSEYVRSFLARAHLLGYISKNTVGCPRQDSMAGLCEHNDEMFMIIWNRRQCKLVLIFNHEDKNRSFLRNVDT